MSGYVDQWGMEHTMATGANQPEPDSAESTTFDVDYEYLGRCMYPVYSNGTMSREDDCGEAAMARVWWEDYEQAWLVCPLHFTLMTKQQVENAEHERAAWAVQAKDALERLGKYAPAEPGPSIIRGALSRYPQTSKTPEHG